MQAVVILADYVQPTPCALSRPGLVNRTDIAGFLLFGPETERILQGDDECTQFGGELLPGGFVCMERGRSSKSSARLHIMVLAEPRVARDGTRDQTYLAMREGDDVVRIRGQPTTRKLATKGDDAIVLGQAGWAQRFRLGEPGYRVWRGDVVGGRGGGMSRVKLFRVSRKPDLTSSVSTLERKRYTSKKRPASLRNPRAREARLYLALSASSQLLLGYPIEVELGIRGTGPSSRRSSPHYNPYLPPGYAYDESPTVSHKVGLQSGLTGNHRYLLAGYASTTSHPVGLSSRRNMVSIHYFTRSLIGHPVSLRNMHGIDQACLATYPHPLNPSRILHGTTACELKATRAQIISSWVFLVHELASAMKELECLCSNNPFSRAHLEKPSLIPRIAASLDASLRAELPRALLNGFGILATDKSACSSAVAASPCHLGDTSCSSSRTIKHPKTCSEHAQVSGPAKPRQALRLDIGAAALLTEVEGHAASCMDELARRNFLTAFPALPLASGKIAVELGGCGKDSVNQPHKRLHIEDARTSDTLANALHPSLQSSAPALVRNEAAVELGGLDKQRLGQAEDHEVKDVDVMSSLGVFESPAPAVMKNEAVEHGGLKESHQQCTPPDLEIRTAENLCSKRFPMLAVLRAVPTSPAIAFVLSFSIVAVPSFFRRILCFPRLSLSTPNPRTNKANKRPPERLKLAPTTRNAEKQKETETQEDLLGAPELQTPPRAVTQPHSRTGFLMHQALSPVPPTIFYSRPRPSPAPSPPASPIYAHAPDSSPLSSVPASPVALARLTPAAVIAPKQKPAPKPVPKPTAKPWIPVMSAGPTFTGAGTSSAAALDFLKDVHLGFNARGVTGDTEKLMEVGDRFRHGTPADVWFKGHMFATWADFQKDFEVHFAGRKAIVKPKAQLLAELSGMRITVAQLAAGPVLVGREKIAPLIDFHERVKEAVMDAGAEKESEGVWAFHTALPCAVMLSVGGMPADWDAMLTALEKVPEDAVDVEIEHHRQRSAFNATIAHLNQAMQNVRVSSANPHVQPTTVVPTVAAPNPANAAPAPTMGQERGEHGEREEGSAREFRQGQRCRRDERQPPDTPKGRNRYATQITNWTSCNSQIPTESVAIYLTDTQSDPGQPRHAAESAGAPPVPVLKRKYRATCGTWFGCIHGPPVVVNVVEIAEVEGMPWYGGEQAQEGGGEAATANF
ncbi:hypothetical protein B0H17DRAFT_1134249 [Mycena rosella]|uniref:Uncharacterized protein n=1 Tax=Mycena rosella TaxID=1033263 RepID=A0AAD7GIJ6_MYCRO|nr:hypothetical protein B0H17DRAFT_1134249 [Mycena rosella]